MDDLTTRLEATIRYLSESAAPYYGYGSFHGGDPRDFTPDPEWSTDEERAAHRAACDAAERGQTPDIPDQTVFGPDAEQCVKDGQAVTYTQSSNGAVLWANRQTFGLGSYTVRYPEAEAALATVQEAAAMLRRLKATAEGTDCVWCGLPEYQGRRGHAFGCPWNEAIIAAREQEHATAQRERDDLAAGVEAGKRAAQTCRDLTRTLLAIGQECGATGDETPPEAVARVVRERDEALERAERTERGSNPPIVECTGCHRGCHNYMERQGADGAVERLCVSCVFERGVVAVQKGRAEVQHLQATLRAKNLALDALHHVWCSGGCKEGTHRWTPQTITEEVVQAAERGTARLRAWWEARHV